MLKPCFWPERVWARCLAWPALVVRLAGAPLLERASRLPVGVESDFLPGPV